MPEVRIILPANFKYPKYMGGAWLDYHRTWTNEDIELLSSACDLRISYNAAANTIGRPPSALVHKALDLGIHMQRDWLDLVRQPYKKKAKLLNLNYPYILKPTDHHADLIAVNRIVSKALPGREDVCQDIMLALWESRTSLKELQTDPSAVKSFVKSFRKASFERAGFGIESMDVTLHSDDGPGKSKYEDACYQRVLLHEDDKFIEDTLFGKTYERGFEDKLIDEISAEEESLGVPAALWMRATL